MDGLFRLGKLEFELEEGWIKVVVPVTNGILIKPVSIELISYDEAGNIIDKDVATEILMPFEKKDFTFSIPTEADKIKLTVRIFRIPIISREYSVPEEVRVKPIAPKPPVKPPITKPSVPITPPAPAPKPPTPIPKPPKVSKPTVPSMPTKKPEKNEVIIKVVDEITGSPIQGALVEIYDSTTYRRVDYAITDERGIAVLSVAPSKALYYVKVKAEGYRMAGKLVRPGSSYTIKLAKIIDVTKLKPISLAPLPKPSSNEIIIQVIDLMTGKPIPNALITGACVSGGMRKHVKTYTDKRGIATIRFASGKCLLSIKKEGYILETVHMKSGSAKTVVLVRYGALIYRGIDKIIVKNLQSLINDINEFGIENLLKYHMMLWRGEPVSFAQYLKMNIGKIVGYDKAEEVVNILLSKHLPDMIRFATPVYTADLSPYQITDNMTIDVNKAIIIKATSTVLTKPILIDVLAMWLAKMDTMTFHYALDLLHPYRIRDYGVESPFLNYVRMEIIPKLKQQLRYPENYLVDFLTYPNILVNKKVNTTYKYVIGGIIDTKEIDFKYDRLAELRITIPYGYKAKGLLAIEDMKDYAKLVVPRTIVTFESSIDTFKSKLSDFGYISAFFASKVYWDVGLMKTVDAYMRIENNDVYPEVIEFNTKLVGGPALVNVVRYGSTKARMFGIKSYIVEYKGLMPVYSPLDVDNLRISIITLDGKEIVVYDKPASYRESIIYRPVKIINFIPELDRLPNVVPAKSVKFEVDVMGEKLVRVKNVRDSKTPGDNIYAIRIIYDKDRKKLVASIETGFNYIT